MPRNKQWRLLLTWKFQGKRFDEEQDGLDLRDLDELVRLRDLLVELAKDTWRRDNPGRERLPANIEQQLELRFFKTLPGSNCVPISFAREAPPPALFHGPPDVADVPSKLPVAARRLMEAYRAIHESNALPADFPREAVAGLEKLGSSLAEEEKATIEMAEALPASPFPILGEDGKPLVEEEPPQPIELDAALRVEVSGAINVVRTVEGFFTGEVTMAALKGRATLKLDSQEVPIDYPPSRWQEVTDALHRHTKVRLRIKAHGEVDPRTGGPRRLYVEDLAVLDIPDPDAPSRDAFERWAREEPARLVAALADQSLDRSVLTFAAEIAGGALSSTEVVPSLLLLLAHASPIVREGAVYGLAYHLSHEGVEARLRTLSNEDPSPGVRAAVLDVLEGL